MGRIHGISRGRWQEMSSTIYRIVISPHPSPSDYKIRWMFKKTNVNNPWKLFKYISAGGISWHIKCHNGIFLQKMSYERPSVTQVNNIRRLRVIHQTLWIFRCVRHAEKKFEMSTFVGRKCEEKRKNSWHVWVFLWNNIEKFFMLCYKNPPHDSSFWGSFYALQFYKR